MLSEEWELLKKCVSEICVKRIRVNQALGVFLTAVTKSPEVIVKKLFCLFVCFSLLVSM